MIFSNKSLFVVVILVACIAVVFAVDVNTGNDVCKKSPLDKGDGTQNPNGSCVVTVMGEIPPVGNMISTVILFPSDGQTIKANTPFIIRTKTMNLEAGFFSDPAKQYYVFPQTLNAKKIIQGHSHVTVQKIIDPKKPLNPQNPDFFQGLNEKVDAKGELTAKVAKGLPAGNYRLCSMVSSFSHQPVLMPVAKRGAQDDCIRFKVRPRVK